MNTVLRRAVPPATKVNGSTVKARADAVMALKPPKVPSHRRWTRLGAGVTAAVLGAWFFASLYNSAGNRTEAIVLRATVNRFEVVKRTDLKVVRISADTEAAHVPSAQIEQVIGRLAATDLVEGSMLVDAQLLPAGDSLLKPDEALVGLLLGAGESQMGLRKGAPVVMIVRPAQGETTAPVEVKGWVYDASAAALNSRERPVEVAVPRGKAALVSAAGADKRVTLVILPG